ncbi:cytochrome c [Pleurocapsa sp. FMAR1]|uniref:cytochrome c n=1 Tax=Pleurocapsa sp. FMAR1 TaxID=3040204 RepID=UPI0029C6FA1A|nr:cytochrome c [Pleurocapsa sp. FMAR1]
MDNQLVQTQAWLNRLFLIIVAVMLMIGISILGIHWQNVSDPYAHEVLSLEGDASKGLAMFQINCAGCHSLQAERNVGPRLENISKRRSQRDLIGQVTSGQTPPMPKFQPSRQEMADLLSYLNQL